MVQWLAISRSVRGTMSCILGILAVILLGLNPNAALAKPRFARGIGVAHTLAWAQIEPASTQFVFPPFADPSRSLAREELISLQRSGFDFVRLATDPGPFLQFKGQRRDALDTMIRDHVGLILSSGLSVIIDFYPSDLNPLYTSQALTA